MSDSTISSASDILSSNMQNMQSIKPSDITDDMLVVDVRTQQEYDRSHYNGAVSLCFPQILWRRIMRAKAEQKAFDSFLIGDTKVLEKRHTGTMIVMYDDATSDIDSCSQINPLRVFGDIFLAEGTKCAFIEGGFQAIKLAFPETLVSTTFLPLYSPVQRSAKVSPVEITYRDLPLNFFLGNFMAIGSEANANDITLLNSHNITHVLNVTPNECLEEVTNSRVILQIPINDNQTQDILCYLEQALEFIHVARTTPNAKLLIHCHAGISRSVSFAIAYVMWAERMSLEDTFTMIHRYRPCASPNLNFMGQLMVFGKYIPPTVTETYSLTEAIAKATAYLRSKTE